MSKNTNVGMDALTDLPGGGPAFPCDPFIASRPGNVSVAKRMAEGMTLRDYFAAKAMQAALINSDRASTAVDEVDRWIGAYAYAVADAMLNARNE